MGERETTDTVIPANFPGLHGLAWNRDPALPMPADEAFALYERDWRHVDRGAMTEPERRLLSELTARFGHGAFLG